MAEDMGLELVKRAQALKFQGGNTSSTFVPGVVPNYLYISLRHLTSTIIITISVSFISAIIL